MGYIGSKPAEAPLTTSQLQDGLVTSAKLANDAVETAKVKDINVTNAKLGTDISAAKLTAGTLPDGRFPAVLPAVSGANLTNIVSLPTISSIAPSAIENTQTAIVLTGTNFKDSSIPPYVDAINSSTGAIVTADSVAFTSSTSVTATFTISVDGTYFLRVENNDGYAARTGTALLTVSDAPTWTTASGNLGTVAATGSVNFTVAATGDTPITYAKTSGSFPGGVTIASATGVISGTESGSTSTTAYSFTITATDAQAQTSARAFDIIISHGASGGAQFN
tara:strand:- start:180 stop:1016 length:837 start_codon:yes stop_codon:yes gene_type:complete